MNTPGRYILMLEDDVDDRQLTKAFFAEQNYDIGLVFLSNAREVISYLTNCDEKGMQFPGLILIDKYMPGENGTTVLTAVKSHPTFKSIPTVIISGSDMKEDIEECYRLGANSYIVKPDKSELTTKKISTCISYWFEVTELPRRATIDMLKKY